MKSHDSVRTGDFPRSLNRLGPRALGDADPIAHDPLLAYSQGRLARGTRLFEFSGCTTTPTCQCRWSLLEQFFHLSGDGDQGARRYRSVFGEHTLERVVYARREGQRIEAVPVDERLQLPAGTYSYLLENWSQELSTHLPFAQAARTLERFLGQGMCVDSLERHSR